VQNNESIWISRGAPIGAQTLPKEANLLRSRTSKTIMGRYGVALVSKERSRFENAIIECRGDRDEAVHRFAKTSFVDQ
jgi:hypothetical protein